MGWERVGGGVCAGGGWLEPASDTAPIPRLPLARPAQLDEGAPLSFSGVLFQPVPWSVNTPRGMPKAFERYAEEPGRYLVVNVPPNFMFQVCVEAVWRLCGCGCAAR